MTTQDAVTPRFASLDEIFRPRAVAVAGVSGQARMGFAGVGLGFLLSLKEMGFEPLYPVNPKYDEIEGLKCYPSVRDIEGPVDHVISSVPAPAVPGLVEDCIAKGVRSIHFFTAGFRETGDEEMAEMEARVVARAREGGIRVFGPNCMGLYVPGSKLSFNEEFPKEPGNLGFLSQSGGNAVEMVYSAAARGLRFSKLISYGNAADVNANELLAYLADDPETEIIGAYVEGVPDGRGFFEAMRHAAGVKPVIVLKGGRTEAGTRAVMSHTASLAGSIEIFDALCRQVNAVRVNSVDEMVDVATAFRFLGNPAGPAVALVAAGGGFSVFAADEVDEAGLSCPVLPESAQAKLRELNPAAGTSIRNPVDSLAIFEPGGLEKTLRIVGEAENIDVLIPHVSVGWGGGRRAMAGSPMPDPEVYIKALVAQITAARDATGKPVAVVVRPALSLEGMERVLQFEGECARAGLPVFPTISRCARAIAKMMRWQSEHAARHSA